ncbi:hypothetical protein BDW59DRAFT_155569 [Aspergillus cavernicola]|uniref:Uncharacterized protein n=1 Tax=Aspergillus cavernicola TaxID=176166 RepID=A0ABR4H6Z0_9EURO
MVPSFASFHCVTMRDYLLGANEHCVAYVSKQKQSKRCSTKFRILESDLSEIKRLYQQYERQMDNKARRETLRDIALICLCHNHYGEHFLAAAVEQWENDICSPISSHHLAEVLSAETEDGDGVPALEFKRLISEKVEALT